MTRKRNVSANTCRIAGVRSTEQSVAYTVCGTTCSMDVYVQQPPAPGSRRPRPPHRKLRLQKTQPESLYHRNPTFSNVHCISPSHARGGLHTRRVRKADYGFATTAGMSMERCEAARKCECLQRRGSTKCAAARRLIQCTSLPTHACSGLLTRRVCKADYGFATTAGMSMERCEAARKCEYARAVSRIRSHEV